MIKLSGPSRIMLTDEQVVVMREDLTIGAGTIVINGKRVKRRYTQFALYCNVQPITGDDLIQDPEGDRFNEQMNCYVADAEQPLQPNDFIFRPTDGWYQVQACEGWGSYTKARMQRVDNGPLLSPIDGPDPENEPDTARLLSRSPLR